MIPDDDEDFRGGVARKPAKAAAKSKRKRKQILKDSG